MKLKKVLETQLKKVKEENDTFKSLRRSLVASNDLKSKTKLTRSMIAIKRPEMVYQQHF